MRRRPPFRRRNAAHGPRRQPGRRRCADGLEARSPYRWRRRWSPPRRGARPGCRRAARPGDPLDGARGGLLRAEEGGVDPTTLRRRGVDEVVVRVGAREAVGLGAEAALADKVRLRGMAAVDRGDDEQQARRRVDGRRARSRRRRARRFCADDVSRQPPRGSADALFERVGVPQRFLLFCNKSKKSTFCGFAAGGVAPNLGPTRRLIQFIVQFSTTGRHTHTAPASSDGAQTGSFAFGQASPASPPRWRLVPLRRHAAPEARRVGGDAHD